MTLTRRQFGAMALAAGAAPGWAQTPSRGGAMGLGLASVTDWGTQQPFLDVMKTARRWIGHRPGQWGGMDFAALQELGVLDDNGWPMRIPRELSSIGTLILTDMPEKADLAGRYVLRFEGRGIVEVGGRATQKKYGRNEVSFDYTPGSGPVDIRIQRSDRAGTGDYVRNITVVLADRLTEFDAGAVFRPGFVDTLRGAASIRFMDWMNTNNADQGDWSNRPLRSDFSFTRRGVPAEVMADLANLTGCEPWLNVPHLADDGYARALATLIKDQLDPELKVYVEYSNELWNWQFRQTEWADAQGMARWGQEHRGAQFSGMRAAEIARIWADVFQGPDRARLVTVIATQTGWLGLERDFLGAPLYVAENPDVHKPPHEAFDAYAVTGYFGFSLGTDKRAALVRGWIADSTEAAIADGQAKGLSGAALDAYTAQHRFDLATARASAELRDGRVTGEPGDSLDDLLTRVLPYHVGVAAEHGLNLVMYEGGTHVVGIGNQVNDPDMTAFFNHLNYTAEMGALYDRLLAGWADKTPGLFHHYSDMQAPTKWGSWGALRYPGDKNPRWEAIERWK